MWVKLTSALLWAFSCFNILVQIGNIGISKSDQKIYFRSNNTVRERILKRSFVKRKEIWNMNRCNNKMGNNKKSLHIYLNWTILNLSRKSDLVEMSVWGEHSKYTFQDLLCVSSPLLDVMTWGQFKFLSSLPLNLWTIRGDCEGCVIIRLHFTVSREVPVGV